MSSNPFRSARSYLSASPAARWGAVVGSVLSSVCLVLLFPILYLFVDLIAWQGRVPGYADLPPPRQRAFQEEWDRDLSRNERVRDVTRAAGGDPQQSRDVADAEWEYRWQAAQYVGLERNVGPDAAEMYLPLAHPPHPGVAPRQDGLGVLATVARERDGWAGPVLGWFAKWNRWAWDWNPNWPVNVGFLTGLLVLAAVLLALRGLLLNLSAYWSAVATIRAATRLRRTVYTHGFRLSAVAIRPDAQEEAGDLVTRRVEQVQDGLQAYLTGSARGPVLTALLLAVLLLSQFWLSLSLLLLAAIVWLVAGQAAAWYRRDARLAGRRAEARLGMMRESLATVGLVKAYLMERFSQSRFERHLSDLSRSSWRRTRGETFSRPTLWAVVAVAGAAMLYLAGRVVLAGDMSVAGLVVKGTAIGLLVFGLNRWIAAQGRVVRGREAAADVFEFLDRRGDAGQPVDAEFLPPLTKKLELVDVSLREPGTGRMVLDGVSLVVPAGSRAAVVSADPAEAHALAHLVTRFAEPTAGEVRIDGKNTRWVTLESLRTHVALVLDGALTFSDTVANNIGCGDPGFTLPQIIEAAKVAHAHGFVHRLPYGYETLIGDGGVALKPGERFRIALARAALRDPSLIVIEEPGEPLDPDSWVLIDDAVSRLAAGRTLLFLARRPSTVKAADRVFVLQNGRLVASGSHDELVSGNELYRLLHFKQSLATTAAG